MMKVYVRPPVIWQLVIRESRVERGREKNKLVISFAVKSAKTLYSITSSPD